MRDGGDSREGSVLSSAQLYDTIGATYTVTRRTSRGSPRRYGLRSAMHEPS